MLVLRQEFCSLWLRGSDCSSMDLMPFERTASLRLKNHTPFDTHISDPHPPKAPANAGVCCLTSTPIHCRIYRIFTFALLHGYALDLARAVAMPAAHRERWQRKELHSS